jgi:hypothetical protein
MPSWRVPAVALALALGLLSPPPAAAECDPGGGCCNDTACCSDGRDNDADGREDCEDPSCAGIAPCGGATENCTNGADDDGDGLIDCLDADCATAPPCAGGGGETDCTNGEDDDRDGAEDCDDSDCASDPACDQETDCTDGRDDDGDGLVDCDDRRDCSDDPACLESNCRDGLDDDGDGLIDCADVDCHGRDCCPSRERCDNLTDDDFDGLIDCEDVDSCIDADPCALPPEDCSDGRDDDRDGLADCDDPQCVRFAGCPPPVSTLDPIVLVASSDRIACLWPPSHDWRCIDSTELTGEVTGACGPVRIVVVSCMSDQADDGTGDGDFETDCIVEPERTCMRAERQGATGAGRSYTLIAVAVDSLGRTSPPVPIGIAVVPRDAREAGRCRLDGSVLLPPRNPLIPRRLP